MGYSYVTAARRLLLSLELGARNFLVLIYVAEEEGTSVGTSKLERSDAAAAATVRSSLPPPCLGARTRSVDRSVVSVRSAASCGIELFVDSSSCGGMARRVALNGNFLRERWGRTPRAECAGGTAGRCLFRDAAEEDAAGGGAAPPTTALCSPSAALLPPPPPPSPRRSEWRPRAQTARSMSPVVITIVRGAFGSMSTVRPRPWSFTVHGGRTSSLRLRSRFLIRGAAAAAHSILRRAMAAASRITRSASTSKARHSRRLLWAEEGCN